MAPATGAFFIAKSRIKTYTVHMLDNKLVDDISRLKRVSRILSSSSTEERNSALLSIRDALRENSGYIFTQNDRDLELNRDKVSSSILHRLEFKEEKLESVLKGIEDVANLADPVGRLREKRELDEAFILERVSVPIGVVGMVFESRPDALCQIASLALKSGNGIILKGGREATFSNRALYEVIRKATEKYSFSSDWILLLESHEEVDQMLRMDEYIDLLIPRGSAKFVRYCMDNTRIPVLGHADGICSVYVDESARVDLALKVVYDSKAQYPAACNAAETLLVHEKIAPSFLPGLKKLFDEKNISLVGCRRTREIIDVPEADADSYDTEFLCLKMAVKVVSSIDEAIDHIALHGSGHTDAIITENLENRDLFFSLVDSADVFWNCSTRFADGFRFGLGAEVGISTSKIHARGPVGLDGLMSSKWRLYGNGQTVAEYSKGGGKSFHHKELI